MDFIQGGDLFLLLDRYGALTEVNAKFYLAEVAAALNHLHSIDVIYRDLKPENVLLAIDGHIRIADFGLSRHVDYGCRAKTVCGTYEYMAPEVILGQGHGRTADWWSFGILAYEMLHLEVMSQFIVQHCQQICLLVNY